MQRPVLKVPRRSDIWLTKVINLKLLQNIPPGHRQSSDDGDKFKWAAARIRIRSLSTCPHRRQPFRQIRMTGQTSKGPQIQRLSDGVTHSSCLLIDIVTISAKIVKASKKAPTSNIYLKSNCKRIVALCQLPMVS